jgi:hypothetical protein
MRFLLRDRNPALIEAWLKEFAGSPSIEVSQGDIFDLAADAIVSPANSFGFMDGGIDLIYSQRFGWKLQEDLRQIIQNEHGGELRSDSPSSCRLTTRAFRFLFQRLRCGCRWTCRIR